MPSCLRHPGAVPKTVTESFFQIQRSNSEKSSKSHAYVLRRTKMALLIDWVSGNGPKNQVSKMQIVWLGSFMKKKVEN